MKRRILAALASLGVVAAVAYAESTYTTHYELEKPGDGDSYGEAIRDNMDTIDEQMYATASSVSAHAADTTDAHDASAISADAGGNLCTSADDVQEFLECLDGVFDPGISGVVLLTGDQTISGTKTFSATPIFSDEAAGVLVTDADGVISADTSPDLGTPSAATLTNATGLPISTGVSGLAAGVASALATPSSANLATAVTDETGSGALVFGTSPTLTTPALGTPSAVVLTNATGLPIATGVSGLAAGVATALATPSSANLATAVTDETGSGALVFGTSPTLVTPALGTPSAAVLTNATGLPVSTGITGLGAGVADALATPSSANLATAVTDETGSGALVFGTSPTIEGGTFNSTDGLNLDDPSTAFDTQVIIDSSGTLTANRTFTIFNNDADRYIALTGDFELNGNQSLNLTLTGDTTLVLPTGGTVATRDGIEQFTDKDYEGGTASNTSRMTVPKASKSTLDGLTRKEATIVYATDDDRLYVDDGSTLTAVGSGSGGVTNYIDNGDAENSTVPASFTTYDDGAAAAVDGTGGTVTLITTWTRTTTAAEVGEGSAGWKLTKSAANAQGEGWAIDFTLPNRLVSTAQTVNLNFDTLITDTDYAAGDIRIYLYDVDGATLITPVFLTCGGGTTPDLAAGDCNAKLSFTTVADNNDYRLMFHVATTEAAAYDVFVDNLFVGTTAVASGTVNGPWTTFTPTGSWVANTTYTGQYRLQGDTMDVQVKVAVSGAPTTADLTINMPSGFTINSSKLTATGTSGSDRIPGSNVAIRDSGTANYVGVVGYKSTSDVYTYYTDDAAAGTVVQATITQAAPITFANGDFVQINFTVPVNESSASALGENKVEYACVTGTWDAAASTTQFGAAGCLMGGVLTDNREKTITWQTSVQATDRIEVWGSKDAVHWAPIWGAQLGSGNSVPVATLRADGAAVNGVVWRQGASANQTIVTFRQYMTMANDDAPTVDWPSSEAYWVVTKARAGITVPFGLATDTVPGLVTGDSYSATVSMTGARSTSTAMTIKMVNKVVNMCAPANLNAACTGTNITAAVGELPSRYRPSTDVEFFGIGYQNNNATSTTPGNIHVDSDGSFTFYRDPAGTAFTAGQNCGWYHFCVSWQVS